MKLGLLLPIALFAGTPILAEPLMLADLVANGDGLLTGSETIGLNKEAIDQADQDIDLCLTEQEYKAYPLARISDRIF